MAAGKTHDRITLWTLPPVAVLTYAFTQDSGITLVLVGSFLFSGLMLGPDLDIYSVQYKRWGWLRWMWIPYRQGMPHRSPLSHFPIIGTCFRVLYLLVCCSLLGGLILGIINGIWQLQISWESVLLMLQQSLQHDFRYWVAGLIGLELGAFSHYSVDWFQSGVKQMHKKGLGAILPLPYRKKKRVRRRKRSGRN